MGDHFTAITFSLHFSEILININASTNANVGFYSLMKTSQNKTGSQREYTTNGPLVSLISSNMLSYMYIKSLEHQ